LTGPLQAFVLDAGRIEDYLLADAVYRDRCFGAKWAIPREIAALRALIWHDAPKYCVLDPDLRYGQPVPSAEKLATRYGCPVILASSHPGGVVHDIAIARPGQSLISQNYGKDTNPTPIHTLTLISQSVGIMDHAVEPPVWPVPRPNVNRVLVHVGPEISVAGNTSPCDILLHAKWPPGTATIGLPSDRLIPGTEDLRAQSAVELRAIIRASTDFIGVPSILCYHAAACGLRTLCVLPDDMVLWQGQGVHIFPNGYDMAGGDTEVIERWLVGDLTITKTPAFDKAASTPHRQGLYGRPKAGVKFHPGKGFRV